MEKNTIFTPAVLIGLAMAFVTVSFLVYVTGGHPALIKKKLKIGAMIIAITSMFSLAGCDNDKVDSERI